jgi:glycosyltransferase involved in cell wall biosynthesis
MHELAHKILIDARSMRKAQNGPSRYAENVLRNLAVIDHKNHYTIIVNNDYADFIDQVNFAIFPTSIEPYRIKEHWAIHRLVKKEKFDLFHSLQYIPPIGLRYPLVMTIYDTMHMDKEFWKGSFYRNVAGKYARLMARNSIQRAVSVITISGYSAKQIEKTFQYPFDKIFPIHLGVDNSYHNRNYTTDFTYSANKWNLPSPYLLSISNMRPYKNVDTLILAFADLVKSGYDHHVLVLAGKASDTDMNSKLELAASLSIGNKIFLLKGLNDNDLKGLLGGSSIFIFPSREEGFGLPLLEAMASGVPCVASDIEVFREVCGDAPLYFDPNDVTDLKKNILKLILSDQLRNELSKKGLQRAKGFSWENTAKQTLTVYSNILINKV